MATPAPFRSCVPLPGFARPRPPRRSAARAAAAAAAAAGAVSVCGPRATTATTHLRGFRATAASATGVKARLKFIPALPQPRDETGRLKRGGADDVYFHDTGNPVTREAFARAAKDSANADPCFRWLYTGGLRFYDMLEKPRNYLAGDCPYPMNPYYRAIPPISNETRNAVFLLHQDNPTKWTPFRLAEEYGLSVSRVEAIIKSKRTEVAMYRNKAETVENVFAATMDKILGAQFIRRRASGLFEDTFSVFAPEKISPTPRILALPEEASINHENAASTLNVMSLAETKQELQDRANAREDDFTQAAKAFSGKVKIASHDELVKIAPVIEPPNPLLANPRHSFCVTDVSNKLGSGEYGRRTLIRERDGSLREATPVERKAAIKRGAEAPDCFVGKWGKKYYKGFKLVIGRGNGVHRKINPNNWF